MTHNDIIVHYAHNGIHLQHLSDDCDVFGVPIELSDNQVQTGW